MAESGIFEFSLSQRMGRRIWPPYTVLGSTGALRKKENSPYWASWRKSFLLLGHHRENSSSLACKKADIRDVFYSFVLRA